MRNKINGYTEPDWAAPENQSAIREIITNLFCTPQNGNKSCPHCGAPFPQHIFTLEEAAMSTQHGRGCIWAATVELFGVKVNQR